MCMCHTCISVPITIKTWLQNVCFKIAVTKCKKGISMCYMASNTTGQGKPHLYLLSLTLCTYMFLFLHQYKSHKTLSLAALISGFWLPYYLSVYLTAFIPCCNQLNSQQIRDFYWAFLKLHTARSDGKIDKTQQYWTQVMSD